MSGLAEVADQLRGIPERTKYGFECAQVRYARENTSHL